MAIQGRTKLTPKNRQKFCDVLRETACVTTAARAVDMSKQGVYDHRKAHPEFAAMWDEALDEGIDLLEREAHRRAFKGVEEPVHYQGQRVDLVRKYSDVLTIFLLKSHRPQKYVDRLQIGISEEDVAKLQRRFAQVINQFVPEEFRSEAVKALEDGIQSPQHIQ